MIIDVKITREKGRSTEERTKRDIKKPETNHRRSGSPPPFLPPSEEIDYEEQFLCASDEISTDVIITSYRPKRDISQCLCPFFPYNVKPFLFVVFIRTRYFFVQKTPFLFKVFRKFCFPESPQEGLPEINEGKK